MTTAVDRLGGGRRIALSAASQTVGNLVVALGAVAVLRITTHALGPADYGLFVLVVTYVSLFSLFADVGITAMTTRELAREGADRPSVLSVAISSRVALSIVVIPVILGTGALLYPHRGSLFHVALLVMSGDVLFQSVQLTAVTAFAVRVRGDLIALLSLVNRGLYVALVVLVAVLHGSYLGYVCALVGADAVTAALSVVAARRSVALRWTGDIRKWWRSLATAFPLGVIQIIGSIYSWIDGILLSLLRSTTDLGFYSVAFNVINLLGSMPSFLMQALIPSLVNADRDEVSRLVNRAVYVLYCIGALLAAGGIVLRVDVIAALAGPHFRPAALPLAILACTIPLSFLQTVVGYTSVSIDRYRPLIVVGVGTLGLNVVINLLLIPGFGPSGAASALLISELVSLVLTYRVFRHLSGVQVRWRSLVRPTAAAGAVLGLSSLRDPVWAHLSPLLAVCVGGTLVVGVYLFVLLMIGGLPKDLGALVHHRTPRHHKKRSW